MTQDIAIYNANGALSRHEGDFTEKQLNLIKTTTIAYAIAVPEIHQANLCGQALGYA